MVVLRVNKMAFLFQRSIVISVLRIRGCPPRS